MYFKIFVLITVFLKETIAPIPSDSVNEQQITSQRRMTRFQQSILDKSLQSTSIVE